MAMITGQELKRWQDDHPTHGLSTPPEPIQGYEVVAEVGELLNGRWFTMNEFRIDCPDVQGTFIESRKELFELMVKHQEGYSRGVLLHHLETLSGS